MARVFIDPGHGGQDNGAKYGHHEEDDYNLAVAFFVDYELRLRGIGTQLSRYSDSYASLGARVDQARNYKADVFVSIHCDAWHNETANGFSVHVYRAPHELGSAIYEEIQKTLPDHQDRGLRESNFYVLRKTAMPAVLVECEFITNKAMAKWLKEVGNQKKMGRAIAAGVCRYLANKT